MKKDTVLKKPSNDTLCLAFLVILFVAVFIIIGISASKTAVHTVTISPQQDIWNIIYNGLGNYFTIGSAIADFAAVFAWNKKEKQTSPLFKCSFVFLFSSFYARMRLWPQSIVAYMLFLSSASCF